MIGRTNIDTEKKYAILTPEEVARFLRKSTSWVYKNWQELGGRKLGGSLFFPGKENLYERIFSQGKGMEVRLHPQRNPTIQSRIQNQNFGQKSRSQKKGGLRKTETGDKDSNRHGLLGPFKPEA